MPEETKSPPTISSSVDAADKAVTEEPKEESKEEKKESEKKEEPKPDEPDETGLTLQEQEHAVNLFKALKDPGAAKFVIRALAEQANLTPDSTKQEKTEAKSTIVDVLKESLGTEFSFLADKLAPGIEKIVSQITSEKIKPVEEKLTQEDAKREANSKAEIEAEVDKALEDLYRSHPDAKELEKDIYELMDKVLPGKDTTAGEYFEMLYASAVSKKTVSKKIERNRTDAPSRLASQGVSPKTGKEPPSKMSLKDAVGKAAEELEEQFK